jgi:hypothetical protein
VVLDKVGDQLVGDQLDRSCERCSITQLRRRGTSYKIKQRNANWIGHILSTNYLLQHDVQGKIEGTVRRGTRSKQLLDDLNLFTPNDNYSGRTAPLTSKVSFYIFIQQIQLLNILKVVYTLRLFLFKMEFVS